MSHSPAILRSARLASDGVRPAPVHLWNPPFCGHIPMRIHRDGHWSYMGTPIARPAMVRLFASILRRDEDGGFYLVTPVERVGIKVDDAPFVAVDAEVESVASVQRLVLHTNLDERVVVDAEHPLCFGERPYVRVRDRLDALISRPLFYRLVEEAVEHTYEGACWLGIWSSGQFFPMALNP